MINEKIEHFTKRQEEITDLAAIFEGKKREIVQEFTQKKSELEKEYQDKIDAAAQELTKRKEEYKAELKAWVGITDGENANILDVVKLARTVAEMMK